jgi:amidohydrolase
MIADGALDGVDRVFGIHLFTPLPSGRVAVKDGPIFGSADAFTVTVTGRGGHGGMPHLSADPIVTAAQIITEIQTIVSRETSPFSPAVVTVGKIEGGSAFNIIPESVTFIGTVRAVARDERDRLLRRINEIAEGIAAVHGCTTTFEVATSTPPVLSDADSAGIIRAAAVAAVGEDHVDYPEPVTVGDDVAYFLEKVPGCYFLVGAGYHDRTNAPHHHPEFDIDEACLPVGVETMTRAALAVLEPAS